MGFSSKWYKISHLIIQKFSNKKSRIPRYQRIIKLIKNIGFRKLLIEYIWSKLLKFKQHDLIIVLIVN